MHYNKLNLICLICHGALEISLDKLYCNQCDVSYNIDSNGFYNLVLNDNIYSIDTTTESYVKRQEERSIIFYNDFIKPFIVQEPCDTILDIGCGIGKLISLLRDNSFTAYGIDLPNLSSYWSKLNNNPDYFYCCDASKLPFPDDYFDVVFSLGVIEHIGTKIGHCTLSDDYQLQRQQYAQEILRVSKPGGRILISCPNKSFPIDFQHGVKDEVGSKSLTMNLRDFIYKKTKLNFHAPWGKYHLLSYGEIKKLFGKEHDYRAVPLKGYLGFSRYQSGIYSLFVGIMRLYLEYLPEFVRSSCLNPYLLIEIRK